MTEAERPLLERPFELRLNGFSQMEHADVDEVGEYTGGRFSERWISGPELIQEFDTRSKVAR